MTLFVWDADRDPRFVRVDDAPRDGAGRSLVLFNGSDPPSGSITVRLATRGEIPDFLYHIGLLLFVSERVVDIVRSFRVPGVSIVVANVVGHKEQPIGRYYWLNVKKRVRLMDRDRSLFEVSTIGIVKHVASFRLLGANIPPDDLFLCEELAIPVFTDRLVAALRTAGCTGAVFTPLEGLVWP